MDNYKVKTVKTNVLKYAKRIRIYYGEYETNSNLYIGLYTMNWECYCDITVNLGLELNKGLGYVKADSEAEAFINEQGIGENLNKPIQSGFNTYNLYRFNME